MHRFKIKMRWTLIPFKIYTYLNRPLVLGGLPTSAHTEAHPHLPVLPSLAAQSEKNPRPTDSVHTASSCCWKSFLYKAPEKDASCRCHGNHRLSARVVSVCFQTLFLFNNQVAGLLSHQSPKPSLILLAAVWQRMGPPLPFYPKQAGHPRPDCAVNHN